MSIGHSARAAGTASNSGSASGRKLNDTVECLLHLRSVRDQFRDAELHRTDETLAQQLEELEDRLVDHLVEERELREGVGLLTVAVVGDFNAGKSTFINALIGTDLCPVGAEPTTASVTHFIPGDKQRFELEIDGTRQPIGKEKYLSMVRHGKVGDRVASVFHVTVDSPVLDYVRLVDTPGFNAPPPNRNDTKVTEDAVATADALFVIMDVRKGNPSKTLLEQLDHLRGARRRNESDPPAFLLLNKAESIPPSQRSEVKGVCEKQYGERFRKVATVSALRLNDAGDANQLKGLKSVTDRIRGALARQESFKATISATVVTNRVQPHYRVDIDGNVYEAAVSSDLDLASRDKLTAMVRSVASERHALLKNRLERRTAQLRADWLNVAAAVDGLCEPRAADMSSGPDHTHDGHRHDALNAIDHAKRAILEQARSIFHDSVADALSKGHTKIEGFWSDKLVHHTDLHLGRMQHKVRTHNGWNKIRMVVTTLTGSLRLASKRDTVPDSDRLVAELRVKTANIVLNTIEGWPSELIDAEGWERKDYQHWRLVSEENEASRDNEYDQLSSFLETEVDQMTHLFAQDIQPAIDKLQEAVIMHDEQKQAVVRDKNDELTKLRQRIAEMKKHTP